MQRSRMIRLGVVAGAMVILGAAALAAYKYWPVRPPDPAKASPEEIAKFMASDAFAKLPLEEKQKYMQRPRQGGREAYEKLSDDERAKLRQNMGQVFEQGMQKQMDEYFALPEDQRVAQLDRMIDAMQAGMNRPRDPNRMGARPRDPNRMRDANRPRDPNRRGWGPNGMMARLETTDPKVKAQRAEFWKAFSKRMEERGITFPMRRSRG